MILFFFFVYIYIYIYIYTHSSMILHAYAVEIVCFLSPRHSQRTFTGKNTQTRRHFQTSEKPDIIILARKHTHGLCNILQVENMLQCPSVHRRGHRLQRTSASQVRSFVWHVVSFDISVSMNMNVHVPLQYGSSMHTYIPHTDILHTEICVHSNMHTNMHTHIYIYPYMHTCIHAYKHIRAHMHRHRGDGASQWLVAVTGSSCCARHFLSAWLVACWDVCGTYSQDAKVWKLNLGFL